jgi:hypothetical protein
MWVLGQERMWGAMHVGKVAAPTTRDAYLLTRRFGVVHNHDAAASICSAHHSSGTSADYKCINLHISAIA